MNSLDRILKSEFVRNVLTLVTGTTLAQLIPILFSPVLTRIYSPEDFGLFGLFMSIGSILLVFSSGRYDLSIIEPKDKEESNTIVYFSIIITVIFCIAILIPLYFFSESIALLLKNKGIEKWLVLVPVAVFGLSMNSILSLWLNRDKKYKLMSLNRIQVSITNAIVSVLLGFLNLFKGGLIFGYSSGLMVNPVRFYVEFKKEPFKIDKSKIFTVMKKYKDYPLYMMPSSFLSEISVNLPIILISAWFGETIIGYYILATRITALPSSFLGKAIGEVYRQKASVYYHEHANCKELYIETLKKLIIFASLPLLVLFFFGEKLFPIVFGNQWEMSGEVAKWLSFIVFFNLISTPLAYTITFNKSQKYDLILQIFRAIFSILSIYIGFRYNNFILGIKLYSLAYSIYYVLNSMLQYWVASGNKPYY